MTQSCACHTVALFVGLVCGEGYHALRQRLRAWCYDAADKKGLSRQEIDVTGSFAPLLAWVMRLWQGPQVALALDATHLGDRFIVLTISVVYRGCALPVAWKVLPAQETHAWRREWLRLLRLLRPAIPSDRTVLVLADRGLYARWLFHRIVRLGWHPFPRRTTAGTFQAAGRTRAVPLREFVPPTGTTWRGAGQAFRAEHCRLACTLVACWDAGYTAPWFILTDLPPAACTASWYGVRTWIEQGFKVIKRGGWPWQHTRMTDPARAERLWLALAVATLWVVSTGDAVEQDLERPVISDLSPHAPTARPRARLTRLFRLGQLALLAAAVTGRPLPPPTPSPSCRCPLRLTSPSLAPSCRSATPTHERPPPLLRPLSRTRSPGLAAAIVADARTARARVPIHANTLRVDRRTHSDVFGAFTLTVRLTSVLVARIHKVARTTLSNGQRRVRRPGRAV